MTGNTIEYYNRNAETYYVSTVNANMQAQYDMFEKRLLTGARILDCGCGSGRDTRYFLEKGYQVAAIDGSMELCKKATAFTGIKVKNMLFQDINFENEFDGVWACASLLHLSPEELPGVFKKIAGALKDGGILYVSFKFGDYRGERDGRRFTDLNEESLAQIIRQIQDLTIQETSITDDARGDRDEKWLNAILVKG
ncbi:MAG: class I SAM-dependent methyltransferase [Lachnospiraceae bacterium]|nr:class I SAM-dependent methyltransferase [Lachnospiraceae bacterium]